MLAGWRPGNSNATRRARGRGGVRPSICPLSPSSDALRPNGDGARWFLQTACSVGACFGGVICVATLFFFLLVDQVSVWAVQRRLYCCCCCLGRARFTEGQGQGPRRRRRHQSCGESTARLLLTAEPSSFLARLSSHGLVASLSRSQSFHLLLRPSSEDVEWPFRSLPGGAMQAGL